MAYGFEPLTWHSRNGFIHHILFVPNTKLPKSSEGALGGLIPSCPTVDLPADLDGGTVGLNSCESYTL
ncbi:MAG: hypothetical protein HW389_1476 [Bacteroidetes bacterium]|nr:hypothetical protein [Bacteroidota bacterium]